VPARAAAHRSRLRDARRRPLVASAAPVVGTADEKQAHGSPTDPTRDPETQIQVPYHPQCPLGAPYLVRTCDVTAHRSPAGRRSARSCSRDGARARCNAAWSGLSLEGGAPTQMVFVVLTTPQEPRRGPPIPTSALWAVIRYDHQQSHSAGCAARSRQVTGDTYSASQAHPLFRVVISLGGCCCYMFCLLVSKPLY
jgi:hypothetical protein